MIRVELYGVDLEFDGRWIVINARNAMARGALGSSVRRVDVLGLESIELREAKLMTNGCIEFRNIEGVVSTHFRRKQSESARAIYQEVLKAIASHQDSNVEIAPRVSNDVEIASTQQPGQEFGEASTGAQQGPQTLADPEIEITEEFSVALGLLSSGSNIFLTGKAGTGKSTLIRHFMKTANRNIAVVAPTGIAALNVSGYTIHRLFGFGTSKTLDDIRRGDYYPTQFAHVLKALDVLIIDEASMVRADLLDQIALALKRFGPKPGKPFGGVQIVLVGDLYQLPPVVKDAEKDWLESHFDTPYFFSAESFSDESFPTISLTKVYRQQGDSALAEILNSVREGVLIEQMRNELNRRTNPDFEPPEDEFWLTVAPTNLLVNARNRQALDKLQTPEREHHAVTSGDITMFDSPVEEMLRFKDGAQVMMLNNDLSERWVNGTIGKIVTSAGDGAKVDIKLNDGPVVEVEPHTWEITAPIVKNGILRREVVGTYRQLPFKLAWAVTIHKCQGQTLDRLIVDLSGGVFDYGQAYVALSRCTSMKGLVLKREVQTKDLKTDRRVVRFLSEATTASSSRKYCAVGVLTVGDEGFMSRPRPIEIAIAFEDGSAISTLVNPERDLSGARERYGISVDDIHFAPTLKEAWAVLAAALAGYTPVGIGLDDSLGLIDFELKRLGVVQHLPLGNDLKDASLTSAEREAIKVGTALGRARATLAAHLRLHDEDPAATAFVVPDEELALTYLLTRDGREAVPSLTQSLSALIVMSQVVSFAVLDGEVPAAQDSVLDSSFIREIVASRLASSVAKTSGLSPTVRKRLLALEPVLGVCSLSEILVAQNVQPREVLRPGVRVCFTGDAFDLAGKPISRSELQEYCSSVALTSVKNVTKSKCDVLVVAELGTQSKKARMARNFGKPVISVEQFLMWDPNDFIEPQVVAILDKSPMQKDSDTKKEAVPVHATRGNQNQSPSLSREADCFEALRLQREGWTREAIGEKLGGRSIETVKSLLSDAKFYEDPSLFPERLGMAKRAAKLRASGNTQDATVRILGVSKKSGARAWRDAQVVAIDRP